MGSHLQQGLDIISWYSGKGTAESVFVYAEDSMRDVLGARSEERSFQRVSACDVSHLRRDVLLLRRPVHARPKHVSGDILDWIPAQDPSLESLSGDRLVAFFEEHASG